MFNAFIGWLIRKAGYGRLATLIDNIVEEMVGGTSTADVVEREKIDKAIEEIEDLFDESLSEAPCSEMQFRCGLTRAREILERNIIGDNNG